MINNKKTPILVANTLWPLPESLINDVKQERMINSLIDMISPLSIEDQISWAECVAYLMPATSECVLNSKVQKIYLYCVYQYLKQKKMEIPEIGLVKDLTDYEMQQLQEFKLWIYKQRGGEEKNSVINALKSVFRS